MSAPVRRCLAFVTWIAVAGTARATDFTDYEWTYLYGATVQPKEFTIFTCGQWGDYWALASFVAPLPGTFTMDMHYEVGPFQEPSVLSITVDGSEAGGVPLGSWCAPGPCSGDVPGIVLSVAAGDVVAFHQTTGWQPFCNAHGGTTCAFTNLQFLPEPGVHSLGGGVPPSYLFSQDPDESEYVFGGLAQLGDVNGDGRADWAFGVIEPPVAGGYGFARIMSGLDGSVLHQLEDSDSLYFGSAIADVGDLDADGADDLAVTDWLWPASGDPLGRVQVASGATGDQLFALEGTQPDGEFGHRIAGVGDIDGDGVGDILVGAYKEDGPAGEEGAGVVRVYSGATQTVIFQAFGSLHDWLGYDVAGPGDVNGDGTPDFCACAPGYATENPAGFARVWSGAGGILYTFPGVAAKKKVPTEVEGAGDVDADGHADLIVGSPGAKIPGLVHVGSATVRSGATGVELFEASGTQPYESLGAFASRAGDLDGDGFDDVLVGAEGNGLKPGHVLALAGPTGAALFDIEPALNMSFYSLVAGGHDLDGDGVPDVLVSADSEVRGYSGSPAKNVLPLLAIDGPLLGGSALTISVADGPPGGTATLVVGLQPAAVPFKGGTLVPSIDRIYPGLPLQPEGSLQLQTTWPPAFVSPFSIIVQAWFPTADAAQGFAGSDALLVAPP